jgi:translocation and assembly module TamB
MSEQDPISGSGPETGPDSEHDSGLPIAPEPTQPRKPRRLRRFFLRHVPLSLAALAILLAVAVAGLFFWASSSRGEALMRQRLVAWLEQATGGRVEIATFHWHLLNLEADAGGLVIHGLEAPGEAPYAQVENLRVRLSVLGFLSPRILLREAVVTRPAFHLIVYADGTGHVLRSASGPGFSRAGRPAL